MANIPDQQLTENFWLHEFTRSNTAAEYKLDNSIPHEQVLLNIIYLCEACLQPMRKQLNAPIKITSGYRCPAVNDKVRGVYNSQHLLGLAADIKCPSLSTGALYDKIEVMISRKQIVHPRYCAPYYYDKFVHIDVHPPKGWEPDTPPIVYTAAADPVIDARQITPIVDVDADFDEYVGNTIPKGDN